MISSSNCCGDTELSASSFHLCSVSCTFNSRLSISRPSQYSVHLSQLKEKCQAITMTCRFLVRLQRDTALCKQTVNAVCKRFVRSAHDFFAGFCFKFFHVITSFRIFINTTSFFFRFLAICKCIMPFTLSGGFIPDHSVLTFIACCIGCADLRIYCSLAFQVMADFSCGWYGSPPHPLHLSHSFAWHAVQRSSYILRYPLPCGENRSRKLFHYSHSRFPDSF